jgi:hypothetical protein
VITNKSAVMATPMRVQSHSSVADATPPSPRMIEATPWPVPLKVTSSISHFVIG